MHPLPLSSEGATLSRNREVQSLQLRPGETQFHSEGLQLVTLATCALRASEPSCGACQDAKHLTLQKVSYRP